MNIPLLFLLLNYKYINKELILSARYTTRELFLIN